MSASNICFLISAVIVGSVTLAEISWVAYKAYWKRKKRIHRANLETQMKRWLEKERGKPLYCLKREVFRNFTKIDESFSIEHCDANIEDFKERTKLSVLHTRTSKQVAEYAKRMHDEWIHPTIAYSVVEYVPPKKKYKNFPKREI